jgi:hypothetical protein
MNKAAHGQFVSRLILIMGLPLVTGVLEISPMAMDGIVENLRDHIFVDSRYLSKRPEIEYCDSLSGPDCGSKELAYSGVIPEQFGGDRLRIDFDIYHQALPTELWDFNYTQITTENYVLPVPSNSLLLRNLPDGGRITSRYSMALPSGSGLARLEGRWLLEDSVSLETLLPAYIKFSQPMMVKSLWAELTLPFDFSGSPPVVIVAFRMGKETVWTTEAIVEPGFTLDLTSRGSDGHGPLRACDQIVIYSTMKGLKIVSIDFEQMDGETLVPAVILVPPRDTRESLLLKPVQVDASALINRKIVSLREAIDNNYQMTFPTRRDVNGTQLVAELVAKDIGVIAPISDVFKGLKEGSIKVPSELRKALLKHEKDVKKLVRSLAQRAIDGVITAFDPTDNAYRYKDNTSAMSEDDARLMAINDLFIAALLHL